MLLLNCVMSTKPQHHPLPHSPHTTCSVWLEGADRCSGQRHCAQCPAKRWHTLLLPYLTSGEHLTSLVEGPLGCQHKPGVTYSRGERYSYYILVPG